MITTDKNFATKFVFINIKRPVKVRDIYKIERNNSIGISAFGYQNREKYPIYVSQSVAKKKRLRFYQ